MSFLDLLKRSIGVDEGNKASMNRKKKENAAAKKEVPSSHTCTHRGHHQQVNSSNISSSSRSSPESGNITSQRRSSSNCRSRFSQLSCEIVQLQKMVRELEALVSRSGDTPETQWRSRIVLRSAAEADTDIGKKIRHQEQTVRNVYDPSVRASYQKLKRDYARAHDSFKTLSSQYIRQQQEAIAQFGGEQGWDSPEDLKMKTMTQEEEDFFYRSMRERESEITKLNESMHKVNNIYEELGRIVQDQQGQIDAVEDKLNEAAATTRAGVDHLQRKFPYCGKVEDGQCGKGDDETPRLRTEEAFQWFMPFETMGEDIKEVVQKDIMGFGNDIISLTKSPSMLRATKMLQCAPSENFEDDDDDNDDDDDDDNDNDDNDDLSIAA